MGTLRFKFAGYDKEIKLQCMINPNIHHSMRLLSAKQLDRLSPGNVKPRLWDHTLKFEGHIIPMPDKWGTPHLELEILSGDAAFLEGQAPRSAQRKGVIAMASRDHRRPLCDEYEIVHRICAHAGPETCRRTADKAKGLFKLDGTLAPTRPCPCCALAKLKAPAKGHGDLSTGIRPSRPGQILSGDTFGPLRVPGLAGERYFIVLVCQYSGYGFARAVIDLKDVPSIIEEMLNEVEATLEAKSEEVIMTLHLDNASYFTSAEIEERMAKRHVSLHYAAPYDPRTNPYAERYGGVVTQTTRAMLLEGSYPS